MGVGIYTRWQRRDSTYAAIQIADLLSHWQCEVTILTPTPTKPPVSSFWDGRVHHDSQVRFTDWAASLATVIWTFCPHPAQPLWASKAGKQTVLVPDWSDLHMINEVGPFFGRIMAPTRCWADLLESRGARNITLCPWSPVLPITERAPVGPIRVYIPPVDRPDDEDDSLAVDVVEALLSLDSSVQATVSTDGRRGSVAKRLDRMARTEPRLTLDRPVDYHQQVLRFGEHSLTLLSAVVENFGMLALCSFHMGTPVVGFNVQALDEVANARNSILVDCEATGCPPGTPALLVPDDRRNLLDATIGLISQPRLSRLFAGCPVGLARRRLEFESAWSAVVPRGAWRQR